MWFKFESFDLLFSSGFINAYSRSQKRRNVQIIDHYGITIKKLLVLRTVFYIYFFVGIAAISVVLWHLFLRDLPVDNADFMHRVLYGSMLSFLLVGSITLLSELFYRVIKYLKIIN